MNELYVCECTGCRVWVICVGLPVWRIIIRVIENICKSSNDTEGEERETFLEGYW